MRVGLRRVNLVEFVDGTFGIRFGWFIHTYQDFINIKFTWSKKCIHFYDCKTTKEVATDLFNRIILGEKIIK